jgi:hypothetical protein
MIISGPVKFILVLVLLSQCILQCLFFCPQAFAAKDNPCRYSGLEFFGSSRISKQELEKDLALKPKATLLNVQKAMERLDTRLHARHVDANVQLVFVGAYDVFLVVDVPDSATDPSPRHLVDPHHVEVSDKPFALLNALNNRKTALAEQGRPTEETYTNGMQYFSDEPCNRIVDHLVYVVPPLKKQLMEVITSDPDPKRRVAAIQLMNWDPDFANTSYQLIAALDDADVDVRSAAAKYLFSRFKSLPNDFPFDELIDALSRQLARPNHEDRVKALFCLLSLSTIHPDLNDRIRQLDLVKVQQLAHDSIIPQVRDIAQELDAKLNQKFVPFK